MTHIKLSDAIKAMVEYLDQDVKLCIVYRNADNIVTHTKVVPIERIVPDFRGTNEILINVAASRIEITPWEEYH